MKRKMRLYYYMPRLFEMVLIVGFLESTLLFDLRHVKSWGWTFRVKGWARLVCGFVDRWRGPGFFLVLAAFWMCEMEEAPWLKTGVVD